MNGDLRKVQVFYLHGALNWSVFYENEFQVERPTTVMYFPSIKPSRIYLSEDSNKKMRTPRVHTKCISGDIVAFVASSGRSGRIMQR